jgi:hypothetical protein
MSNTLARECVTLVSPGETLVVMVPPTFAPRQIRELNDALQCWCHDHRPDPDKPPISIMAVPGLAMAVGAMPADPFTDL